MIHQHSLVTYLVLLVSFAFLEQSYATPLDDYVHMPDPNYSWAVIRTYDQPDYTLYVLNFTSQKWLDGN